MKYFSVPADFKKETIDAYDKLNNTYNDSKVLETYGQITVGNIFGSGRPYSGLSKVDISMLKEYIEYSRLKNIEFNYTLNPSCIGNYEFSKDGINEIRSFLDSLYEAGVRSLTIAMPTLIEIVKTMEYDFSIKASAICQISNANKAISYKQMGVDRVVVDIPVHRDFQALKSIRNAFGEKVEIIVNSMCNKNCIYTMFHYNESSHDSGNSSERAGISYFPYRCITRCHEDNSNYLKISWIRPEDIKYYSDIGINYFKIQGRHVVSAGDPVRTVESYFKASHDGNLMDLLRLFSPTNLFNIYIDNKKLEGFIKPFVENPDFCRNECTACGYCERSAKLSIDSLESEKLNTMAKKFYSECDDFINTIKEVKSEAACSLDVGELIPKTNVDFEFDLD